jgi:hypothetical protein
VRTLQRQIAAWRAQFGPGREVMFAEVHVPGEAAQSDFTHMLSLGVTLGGVPFAHLGLPPGAGVLERRGDPGLLQ